LLHAFALTEAALVDLTHRTPGPDTGERDPVTRNLTPPRSVQCHIRCLSKLAEAVVFRRSQSSDSAQ
jgi:hypothetical protein